MAILTLKTQYKGPAGRHTEAAKPDIVDEALTFFKANVLFRNFDIKGPADRVLIYLTLYIAQCLQKIGTQSKGSAEQILYQLAIENFAIPGDRNFALAGFVQNPSNRGEADTARQYLTQLRQETGKRLVEIVFKGDDMTPSKWWTCFNKRKFLNKSL
eukprot:TRINITY_DN718_c0_g1_i1.p1 TRINITY_DN718_c0_g1~~TRINITY_DN718_c0_g1_i1.p1  ORF type:complete len:157 (-),score=25.13 TRINITY_DN718_c0_g1_i1:435-905(-)